MIPARFDYHRPDSVAAVIGLLQAHGDEARVVAGGHSLIPMMKLRMADVPHLIDIQGLSICAASRSGPGRPASAR